MKELRCFIEQFIPLSDKEWMEISSLFEERCYEKNHILLHQGSVCRYFWFLKEGLIRFYYWIDGVDSTKTFTIAPYFFTSRTSFRTQQPAEENIEILDDAVLFQISFDNYKKLEHLNSWNIFMRKLLNEIQEFSESLMKEVKTETARNRYFKLLQTYPPEIINKIPLKHLSSFLGIAPQSLSRIRKELQKKNKS